MPDIETFAPLITATFGVGATPDADAGELPDERRIDMRVRLADRSPRSTNPVLGVIARLIEMADARVTASQLLDLLDADPVRRRFELGDDELAQIRDWVLASGIHWGLDAAHRSAFRLERVPGGTWEAGLSRILLGVAMSENGGALFERVLPVDDVDSDAIDLAGRLAELVDRVGVALEQLAGPHTIEGGRPHCSPLQMRCAPVASATSGSGSSCAGCSTGSSGTPEVRRAPSSWR